MSRIALVTTIVLISSGAWADTITIDTFEHETAVTGTDLTNAARSISSTGAVVSVDEANGQFGFVGSGSATISYLFDAFDFSAGQSVDIDFATVTDSIGVDVTLYSAGSTTTVSGSASTAGVLNVDITGIDRSAITGIDVQFTSSGDFSVNAVTDSMAVVPIPMAAIIGLPMLLALFLLRRRLA